MGDQLLKRKQGFELNTPTIGMYGGGTSEPEYRDKNGKVIPFNQTKWAKLKKSKDE